MVRPADARTVLGRLHRAHRTGLEHRQAPYGYLADKVPHPVPARRAEGATKHRLVPDPVCGPVVSEIFRLRALERLTYRAIALRLNEDLDKYPPPTANRADVTVGRWTVQSVRGILSNPKYTGYQVWNRKARKKRGNRANPVSEWIWSPRPVHEPLVTREVFNTVWADRASLQGSRGGSEPNSHPATTRSYMLRSYVYCALCDRRMFGKVSKDLPYYVCYKDESRRSKAEWFEQHPKALWMSEKILLDAVHWFFAERVLGPRREEFLQTQLGAGQPAPTAEAAPEQTKQLQEEIKKIEGRQERLLDQLAEDDDGDPDSSRAFRRGIRDRYDRLDRERRDLVAELHIHQQQAASGSPAQNAALIKLLPQLGPRLAELPEEHQRQLYDAYRLEVRYLRPRREIQLCVTIPAATATELAELTARTLTPLAARTGVDQPSFGRPRQDSNLRPSA